ncbi:hypothetical protein Q3G72_032871 [Acer saccharum]|nr:hypothetical protein Q3G72_032871 [Acer saccharum]
MPGVDPKVISHCLSTNPESRPVVQKRRLFNPERSVAIKKEVEKLLSAGSIREVKYPEWVANVVLVKKKNNQWRMCVDFTDLNKACPREDRHWRMPLASPLVSPKLVKQQFGSAAWPPNETAVHT